MARKRKQIKGIQYISDVLRRYKPSAFKTSKSAKEKAREIKDKLKGQKVTVKSILALSKQGRKKKEQEKLSLPEFLSSPQPYFLLVGEIPRSILLEVDKRISFKSKISKKSLPLIQGGTEPDYNTYFADFVTFMNKYISTDVEQGKGNFDDAYAYGVVCTEPKGKDNISNIISVVIYEDGTYEEVDFGFDAENPDFLPTEKVIEDIRKGKEKKEKAIEEKPKEVTPTTQIDKEIELSKERQKEIELENKKLDKIIELMDKGFTKAEIMKLLSK